MENIDNSMHSYAENYVNISSTAELSDLLNTWSNRPQLTSLYLELDSDTPLLHQVSYFETELQCLESSKHYTLDSKEAESDLQKLEGIYKKFKEFIEYNYTLPLATLRLAFESRYRHIRHNLFKILAKDQREIENAKTNMTTKQLQLPILGIPKFHGDLTKWTSFKEIFLNLITHPRLINNDNVKRQFLFQALSGEALSIIEHLRETSFETAWKSLAQFYEDPIRRAHRHYDSLFRDRAKNLNHRESLIFYRQHFTGIVNSFAELKLDPFEQTIINNYLDRPEIRSGLRLEWEKRITERSAECGIEDFFEFMEQHINLNDRTRFSSKRAYEQAFSRDFDSTLFKPGRPKRRMKCYKCNSGEHFLINCPEFNAMPAQQRIVFVQNKSLCKVCLRNKNGCLSAEPEECHYKRLYCRFCSQAHNTALHLDSVRRVTSEEDN